MARLLALLGSINTGGNRIKMSQLRNHLEADGFEDVATVTASGNVIFSGDPANRDQYRQRIERILDRAFGIETFAVILTRESLLDAIAKNPFAKTGQPKLVHTMFLESQPDTADFERLKADHDGRGNEKLAPGTRALHIDFVDGAGGSKLTGNFISRRLGCRGTARNMRSMRRMAEAMT